MSVEQPEGNWTFLLASRPTAIALILSKDRHMLVDGGVVDNVPVEAMKSLKSGPNLVVDLRPLKQRIYDLDYQSIPGRWQLLAKLLNPFSWKKLPACPSPGERYTHQHVRQFAQACSREL
jgi:predicted acylesterase/phospholipase RssA